MALTETSLAYLLQSTKDSGDSVHVELSNELVSLLSEQLYQSPLKAIEELVVNSYDADAKNCRIYVPFGDRSGEEIILVYDDGLGMDYSGLVNLWQVGRSNKRQEEIIKRLNRKQIGKFGIGKLASSTIANQLTYISKTHEGVLGVTINFLIFKYHDHSESKEKNHEGRRDEEGYSKNNPIDLKVYEIDNLELFIQEANLDEILTEMRINTSLFEDETWTLVILEDLKEKTKRINRANLSWVLSTAMPLSTDFKVYLNGIEIESSKKEYEKVVEFDLSELPEKRIDGLQKSTGENWHLKGNKLLSDSFPNGIEGYIYVTERSMYGQKSDDIQRSHGFFVRVRNRLVDLVDPLFGMQPVRYGTLNRFHAVIEADDLDNFLTASRDTVEESESTPKFRALLREIFAEADSRYLSWEKEQRSLRGKREGEKELIAPRLVEKPVADALLAQTYDKKGAEADDGWFYISMKDGSDFSELIQQLYTSPRSKYIYQYTEQSIDRIVKYVPGESTFWINSAHEFVKEYLDNNSTRRMLEDFVTSEMLLEVYMRESHVDVDVIGELLQKRDDLFRSLALDHSYSYSTISQQLILSSNDEYELEINLVVASRALGFNAKQISNSKQPDGIAKYVEIPGGIRKITLEAKSSKNDTIPTSKIDLAALNSHMTEYKADGCLLIAPGYEGQDNPKSSISTEAMRQHISCWTIAQLAEVVELAGARSVSARDIFQIVTKAFSPVDVKESINQLLSEPSWNNVELYRGITKILRDLEGSILDKPRDVSMIVGGLATSQSKKFYGIEKDDVRKALVDLSGVSKGAFVINVKEEVFHLTTDLEEFERRICDLTKIDTSDRRKSSFRE